MTNKFYIYEHLTKQENDKYYELEEQYTSSLSEIEKHMIAVKIGELFDIAWKRYQETPIDRTFLIGMPDHYPVADYYEQLEPQD